MSVGAALALRGSGRLPIAVLGDGDTLMGITALWTAVHYRIPLMIVVANNNSFFNDELHQDRMARQRGRPVANRWIGQRIADPEPDLGMLARAQGGEGFGRRLKIEAEGLCGEQDGKRIERKVPAWRADLIRKRLALDERLHNGPVADDLGVRQPRIGARIGTEADDVAGFRVARRRRKPIKLIVVAIENGDATGHEA